MKSACDDFLLALRAPQHMAFFSLRQWDGIIRQARASGLLGRLGALASRGGLPHTLPQAVWHALEAGLSLANRQADAVRYELNKLDAALSHLGVPVLVLKGAAYVAGGLSAAGGRMMSDIDIMVSRQAIHETESALMQAGWNSSHRDAYDQRYYRQWMHEIPPLRHIKRGTILDVHHNLLPETARIKTRPELIIAAARPLPGMHCLCIPAELDLILHSATHLMHEGEWEHGLRDLTDLHALITDSRATRDDFWTALAMRARELNLERPLHYALVHLSQLFRMTDIPTLPLARPGPVVDIITNTLLARGFSSFHPSCRLPGTSLANFLLFIRSHWLRMSLRLLLPHLTHKALSKTSLKEDLP